MITEIEGSLAKKIMVTQDYLEQVRQPREKVFKEITELVLPGLEDFLQRKQAGSGESAGVRYTGYGLTQLELWADGMFGYSVSPSTNWFMFQMAMDRQNEIPEIRDWTQDLTEYFRWRLHSCNFYDACSTMFEHAGALGYTDIYIEANPDTGNLYVHNYLPGELFFSENQYGIVDTVFRKFQMQCGKAVEKFKDKGRLPNTFLETAKRDPFKTYEFIHAVYPRKTAGITPQEMPFASVWVCPSLGSDEERLVLEHGYEFQPHHVWRLKRGRTPYGIGLAEGALTEIKQDNVISRSLLGAAQRSVEPSYQAPAEMEDRIDLTPHGISIYDDPSRLLQPVRKDIQWPIGVDIMQRIERIIERHFKVEFFTLLAQRESRQPRTATEIIELQGEKAAVLGRPMARLTHELISPIFELIFVIDMKANRLPQPPDILYENGGEIKLELNGPLAQAQKKLFQMQSYLAGLEHLAVARELFGDTVLDWVNEDELAKGILRMDGFDQDAIRDKTQVDKIREGRMLAQEETAEMEDQSQGTENLKKLAMAVKAGGGIEGLKRLSETAGAA